MACSYLVIIKNKNQKTFYYYKIKRVNILIFNTNIFALYLGRPLRSFLAQWYNMERPCVIKDQLHAVSRRAE